MQYTFMFSYICIHSYVFQKPNDQGYSAATYWMAYLQSKNTKTPAERMEAVLQMRTCQREKTRGCVSSVRKMETENDGDV